MSEENVNRFLECIEAFSRGDVERWLETFHPDAVVELQNVELEGGYSGHDGLRRFFADFSESFEMFEIHCPDVCDLGDRVLRWERSTRLEEGARWRMRVPWRS